MQVKIKINKKKIKGMGTIDTRGLGQTEGIWNIRAM